MDNDLCRFYENEFPEVGDLVMVKVLRLESHMGAYVSLLEYGNMEALILPNELSKRRFRSIHKIIKVGRQEVVMVVRVDPEKGYVDLSKKRVAIEDLATVESRFSKSKKVQLTVRQVATKLNISPSEVCEKAIWPLYRKYGHAYDGLKLAMDDPTKPFEGIDCPEELKNAIIEDMSSRLTPTILKLRVRLHVSCTGVEGVHAVRRALIKAEKESPQSAKFNLKVQLVASPLYTVLAHCYDRADGIAKVTQAMEIIKQEITATPGGEFKQLGEIVVCGADDERSEEDDGSSSEYDSSDDDDDEEEEEELEEEEEEDSI